MDFSDKNNDSSLNPTTNPKSYSSNSIESSTDALINSATEAPISASKAPQIQLNANQQLTHLITLESLPKATIEQILDTANHFVSFNNPSREVKKLPLLRGKSVFNLFFENSTRTRTTFEIAANRLSADVINLDIQTSSTSKGESLLDTIDNLVAMQADIFVVHHKTTGASEQIARHLPSYVHVINAGDGTNQHPPQGLLDLFTMRHFKKTFLGSKWRLWVM